MASERVDPVVLPEVTTSFSNSSWAERTKGSPNVRINHDGYFLEFVNTPQRNGSSRPGVILRPLRSLESRTELNSPPIFAGSFWYREQLRFVENHCDDFRIVGSSVVNTVPVTILELVVPMESHREAFHVILPHLKSGGLIRLYVAPQLGFVLPRIEFVTASRQVAQTYDAKGFEEVAAGIYFPAHCSTETHVTGGASRYRGEFAVRCELINQPIPPEDFIVALPMGTRVQDARQPNSVIKFELTKASSSGELAAPSSISELGPRVMFLDRWRNAVIVGIAIGGLASISFLLRPGTSDIVADRQNPHTATSCQCRRVLHLVLIWVLVATLDGSSLGAASVDALLSGSVHRAKVIQSGHLEYQLEAGVVGGNIPLTSQSPIKALTFTGSNWIERSRDSTTILINYGRCSMRYDEVRQANGTFNRTATISPPMMLRDAGRRFRRPWFAGTFWLARQAEYVEHHRAQFRLRRPIALMEFRARCVKPILPHRTPFLHSTSTVHYWPQAPCCGLYCPQLGFVLPLIELKSIKGENVLVYQSKQWLEFPNQVYFPRLTRMELRGPAGETEHEQFKITAERINQPIPESEFVIKLPAGTRIRDVRDACASYAI